MPQVATLVCVSFILYLLWSDMREDYGTSNAVWIPMIWMFLAGTRYVSQWLDLGGPVNPMEIYKEGSLVDGPIFGALIVAGATILFRRRLDWGRLPVQYKWIVFYFLFCAISIVWSDDSFVSFKRWIKALGDVIMALVILTEERPYEAVGTLLRRLAFVILPLSALFIKYYPELGRAYHMSAPMYTGAAITKNSLGQICLISGLYFSWSLIFQWRDEIEKRVPIFTGERGIPRVVVSLLFLVLIAWLFYKADSATSLTCWLVVLGLFLACRIPALASKPIKFVVFGAIVIVLFGVMEHTFGIIDVIITGMGRSKDLTTRVPMWEMLLSLDTNPLIGVGYESFWSGERLNYIRQKYPFMQAHNGYLDLYLNIGLIGLLLLFVSIVSGLVNTIKQIEYNYANSLLRIAFIITVVLYNWTEATIKPVSNMFVILLFGIMDVSNRVGLEKDDDDMGDRE